MARTRSDSKRMETAMSNVTDHPGQTSAAGGEDSSQGCLSSNNQLPRFDGDVTGSSSPVTSDITYTMTKRDTNTPETSESKNNKINKDMKMLHQREEKMENWKMRFCRHFVIFSIIIALGATAINLCFCQETKHVIETKTINSFAISQEDPFEKEFNNLKSNFKAQDTDFWKRIRVPVLRVIKEEAPKYPAIVLLVVPNGPSNSKTATCLAKRYLSILNKLYTGKEEPENGYINVQKMLEKDKIGSIVDFKKALNDKIKELFTNTKPEVPTVVIDHIETLDPNVMLLFHGYCDGDMAPYKKAVFVFVLHTEIETLKASETSEKLDEFVKNYLIKLWEKNLNKNRIFPLISRVANNNALVKEEDISSLTKSGC